jgi:hypothetical protein
MRSLKSGEEARSEKQRLGTSTTIQLMGTKRRRDESWCQRTKLAANFTTETKARTGRNESSVAMSSLATNQQEAQVDA